MSSASPTLITLFGKTDDGRVREHNEDDFVVCTNLAEQDWRSFALQPYPIGPQGALAMVADGMGGANAGEVASRLAAEAVEQYFRGTLPSPNAPDVERLRFMQKAILCAHDVIALHASTDASTFGMGTTAVLCWVLGTKAYVAWSGDSRCYILREGQPLRMLSQDHSLVWELVQAGKLTPAAAEVHPERNIITQSLGYPNHPPKPEAVTEHLQIGDRLLVCSDGLNSMLRDNQIQQILAAGLDPKETCDQLVAAANYAGGDDNITVLLIDIVDLPAGQQLTQKSGAASTETLTGNNQPIERDTLKPSDVQKTPGNLRYLLGGLVVGALLVAAGLFFYNKYGKTAETLKTEAAADAPSADGDTTTGGTGANSTTATPSNGTADKVLTDTAAKKAPPSSPKKDTKPEEKPAPKQPDKPKVELNEIKEKKP